jgi:hypothetical protein
MCGVIAGVMAGGAALSIVAGIKGGIDQRNAANQAARDTIKSADEEARDRLQRAAIDAGGIAAQGAAIAAKHVAAAGGSNVSGGTTDGALIQSNINAAVDQELVKSNAAREAWGIRRQAARQARALKKQGKAAFESGLLGAAGGAVGAAGSIAAYQGRYTGPRTDGT